MATEAQEEDLKRQLLLLDRMLGDTRVRYHQQRTPLSNSQDLIDLDLEIRNALARQLSPELEAEVRRLVARLRTLDPH